MVRAAVVLFLCSGALGATDGGGTPPIGKKDAILVETIIDESETVAEALLYAQEFAREKRSREFSGYADAQLASWVESESEAAERDLANAPLYEVGWAANFVAGFPAPPPSATFPKTAQQLGASGDRLLAGINQRLESLRAIAVQAIKDSGQSYAEVDAVMEAGFALAEEFEDSGFPEHGEAILGDVASYVEAVLQKDLPAFQEELEDIEISNESIAVLQEQASAFGELSEQLPGYAPYKEAVENKLAEGKEAICEGALVDAGIGFFDRGKRLYVGEEKRSFAGLACSLRDQGHSLSGFSANWWPGEYTLSITEAQGVTSRFHLVSDSFFFRKDMRVRARVGDQLEPLTDDQWTAYVAKLTRVPSTGEPDKQGVRECDMLAADPDDPQKLATGVKFDGQDVDPELFDRALDACVAAAENAPADARQLFQLGRLLWYTGDQEGASEYLTLAANANYAPAIYYRAQILLGVSSDQNAFIDALEMFGKAGQMGYAPGTSMVKELNPSGIAFFREIPRPTEKELVSALLKKGASQTTFGVTTSVNVVGVKIKDCFQTSATDFSCEYRKIVQCRMSGSERDPMLALMQRALQSDCDSTVFEFGSFRKIEPGKWKELPGQS